jgi:hypothetical protein
MTSLDGSQITALPKAHSRLLLSGAVQSRDDGDRVNFNQEIGKGQRCDAEECARWRPFQIDETITNRANHLKVAAHAAKCRASISLTTRRLSAATSIKLPRRV